MSELLHPLFLWPLLSGFIVGVGLTFKVYKLGRRS